MKHLLLFFLLISTAFIHAAARPNVLFISAYDLSELPSFDSHGMDLHEIQNSEIHPENDKIRKKTATQPKADSAKAWSVKTVYMANGIKIGDVDQDSAIIWTRLTRAPERNRSGNEFIDLGKKRSDLPYTDGMEQIPTGLDLADMEGAVPGTSGEVLVTYWPTEEPLAKNSTGWQSVSSKHNYTHQFKLEGLRPYTEYQLRVVGRSSDASQPSEPLMGRFITAPTADAVETIRAAIVTCGDYTRRDDAENGFKIYKAISEQIKPQFFVHTGDIEYYDRWDLWAMSAPLARFKMNRVYSMPYARMLHNSVSSYFMKDDHDITKNDAYPGVDFRELTWEQGLEIFDEQFPIGELPYRTVRWGKDLQVWFMEGRNYRSPNDAPDGPEKTIWGAVQKQWFYDTVAESDATFKLVVSPTPIVGPDRLHNKADNHANAAFSHEGNEIRTFISEQPNMFVANGDRHWQYYSIDDETGVREFSVGPHSNKHAAGYSMEKRTSEHQFLRINGGFLVVEVTREEGSPTISFKHYDVDGMVVNDEVFTD